MEALEQKAILVLGTGGPGSAASLALASAGVGRLVLVDDAAVALTDLADGPLLADEDVGRPRAVAAAARLGTLFPRLALEMHAAPLVADATSLAALTALAAGVDLVVGAQQAAAAMFLANDVAVAARRPLVHVAWAGFSAQLLTVLPGATGCLRCLFEGPPPPRPATAGPEPLPLGPLQGFAGALAGAEAARVLEGRPGAYAGRLLTYEARAASTRSVPVRRRQGCAACGTLPDAGVAPRAAPGGA